MEPSAQFLSTLHQLLSLFLEIDQDTAIHSIELVNLNHEDKIKRFSRCYVKRRNYYYSMMLKMTASRQTSAIVRLFAGFCKELGVKLTHNLTFADLVKLIKQLGSPDYLGHRKLSHSILLFLNKTVSMDQFTSLSNNSELFNSVLKSAFMSSNGRLNQPVRDVLLDRVRDAEEVFGFGGGLSGLNVFEGSEEREIRGLARLMLEESYGYKKDWELLSSEELLSRLSKPHQFSLRQVTSHLHHLKLELAYAHPSRPALSSSDITSITRQLSSDYNIQTSVKDDFSTPLLHLLRRITSQVVKVWNLRSTLNRSNAKKITVENETFLASMSGYSDLLFKEKLEKSLQIAISEELMTHKSLKTAIFTVLSAAIPDFDPVFLNKPIDHPFDFASPIPLSSVTSAIQSAIESSLQSVFVMLITGQEYSEKQEFTEEIRPFQTEFPSIPSQNRLFSSNMLQERVFKETVVALAICYVKKQSTLHEKQENQESQPVEPEVEECDFEALEIEALRIRRNAEIEVLNARLKKMDEKPQLINPDALLNLFNSELAQEETALRVRKRLNEAKQLDDEEILRSMALENRKEGKKRELKYVEPVFTPAAGLRATKVMEVKPVDKNCCDCVVY